MRTGVRMVSAMWRERVDREATADVRDVCAAKLAISIARKMNALIFLVPEDIVDVRPRLVSYLTPRCQVSIG